MESEFTVAETLDGVYTTLDFWIKRSEGDSVQAEVIYFFDVQMKTSWTVFNYFVTLHQTQNKQRSEQNGSQKRK
jgi:hypothetical protein